MSEQKPAAWLHRDRPEADVVTDKVKHVWGCAVVGSLAAYSIPLYTIDIDAMVNRFLCWKLPRDFGPDGGINFCPPWNIPDPLWPTGTNLFTAEQAKAMIEHMLGGAHE